MTEPLEKDYEVIGRLGEGAFGKVYKARHRRNDDIVAVKQIKLGATSWEEALKSTELAALKALRHPFIVRLRELIRSQRDGSLYYIFEFIDSDLCKLVRQYPQGLDELRAADLTRQLFAGLAHIHQYNFFHRDIKPENVLYETERDMVRIADFGEARSLRARPPFTDYVGTRWYRAPECLLRDRTYSSLVDVWASGLIFAELLRGQPLFMGNSSIDQLYKIFTVLGQPDMRDWPEFSRLAEGCCFRVPREAGCGIQRVLPRSSPQAIAMVAEILVLNPRRRPLARKVLENGYFSQLPPLDLERLTAGGGPPTSSEDRPDTYRSQGACSSVAPSAVPEDQPAVRRQPSSLQAATPPLSPRNGFNFGQPPSQRVGSGASFDVDIDDLDLDAELDKILGSSPKAARPRQVLGGACESKSSATPVPLSSSQSFNFVPFSRPTPSPQMNAAASQDPPYASLSGARAASCSSGSRANSPESSGGCIDTLLNDLYADLGVDADLGLGSNDDSRKLRVGLSGLGAGSACSPYPSEFSDGDDNDASYKPNALTMSTSLSLSNLKLLEGKDLIPGKPFAAAASKSRVGPWSSEECSMLRKVVKRVVRHGARDKDALWAEVSKEMGGQREARECKLQYARDYKAHKASEGIA